MKERGALRAGVQRRWNEAQGGPVDTAETRWVASTGPAASPSSPQLATRWLRPAGRTVERTSADGVGERAHLSPDTGESGMRVRAGTWAAVVLAGAWGCSGSRTAPATVGGGSDGGALPDAGGDNGGGAGSGGGAADAGSGGSGTADAGTGGGGTADAGSGGGTADAGSGGGIASDCDGIVPARLGSSFTFDVPASRADWTCGADTSDESGNLAAGAGPPSPQGTEWHLFDSNGAHLARIVAGSLLPEGPGFEGIFTDSSRGPPFQVLDHWAPGGAVTKSTVVANDETFASAFRAWPAGALVVTSACSLPPGTLQLRRFDASGNVTATGLTQGGCSATAAAVGDANDDWLVLMQDGTSAGFAAADLVAQWFDPSGRPLGWFRVESEPGGGPHSYLLHALIGGGAALRIDGVWKFFLPSGESRALPAPGFLAEHPQTDFTLVRGAKAYALLPRAGDTSELELFSPTGNRCGALRFPGGNLTTGADGSVIQAGGANGCHKTVWPGLLR